MKNITVSVDDDLYHRARARAAELRTTVSALVRQHLVQVTTEESAVEGLRREHDELIARMKREHAGFSAADRLTRAQVHDRDAVR